MCGSIHRPHRWIHVSQVNCNQYIFEDFYDTICSDIEENPVPGDEPRYFVWDNVLLHKTAYVTHVIKGCNNAVQKLMSVDCPHYHSNLASIE